MAACAHGCTLGVDEKAGLRDLTSKGKVPSSISPTQGSIQTCFGFVALDPSECNLIKSFRVW
jgi:hypothetical protein